MCTGVCIFKQKKGNQEKKLTLISNDARNIIDTCLSGNTGRVFVDSAVEKVVNAVVQIVKIRNNIGDDEDNEDDDYV